MEEIETVKALRKETCELIESLNNVKNPLDLFIIKEQIHNNRMYIRELRIELLTPLLN